MNQRAVSLLALTSMLVGCDGGCSSSEHYDTPQDVGAGEAADVGGKDGAPYDGAADTGDVSAGDTAPENPGDASCPPPPTPSMVPAGWVPFTDYSCVMPLYLPQTSAQLPPRTDWVPCGSEAPSGIACRKMKQVAPYAEAGGLHASMSRGPNGKYRMNFLRYGHGAPPETVIVEDVDGDVLFAVMGTVSLGNGLRLGPAGVDTERFGVELRGGETLGVHADSQHVDGLLVGTIGELRPVLWRKERTDDVPTFLVNDQYVDRGGALSQEVLICPRDGGAPISVYKQAGDPDGCQLGSEDHLIGNDVLLGVDNLRYSGIMAYDPVRGPHPLLRAYGDNTQGYFSPGADGTDLVWTHGTEHPPGEGVYGKGEMMTSPYSTDPDFVRAHARRVRSTLPDPLHDFVVGCGYAAHWTADGEDIGRRIDVVRLSDGVAFSIMDQKAAGGFELVKPIGVDCDEVFIQGAVGTGSNYAYNIYRVRIDSLGKGSPPD